MPPEVLLLYAPVLSVPCPNPSTMQVSARIQNQEQLREHLLWMSWQDEETKLSAGSSTRTQVDVNMFLFSREKGHFSSVGRERQFCKFCVVLMVVLYFSYWTILTS